MDSFSKGAGLAYAERQNNRRPSRGFRKEIIARLLPDSAEVWSWFYSCISTKNSMTINGVIHETNNKCRRAPVAEEDGTKVVFMREMTNVVVLR